MILYCNYEELLALRQGAHLLLLPTGAGGEYGVAAPSMHRTRVEALLPRLEGDVAIPTLAEQRVVEVAVRAIVECLRAEMETEVVTSHPADEGAVAAYFDYAHSLAVLERLHEMGSEMEALIEVVTGAPPDEHTAASFAFPD